VHFLADLIKYLGCQAIHPCRSLQMALMADEVVFLDRGKVAEKDILVHFSLGRKRSTPSNFYSATWKSPGISGGF
jgi:hypothetical protein